MVYVGGLSFSECLRRFPSGSSSTNWGCVLCVLGGVYVFTATSVVACNYAVLLWERVPGARKIVRRRYMY